MKESARHASIRSSRDYRNFISENELQNDEDEAVRKTAGILDRLEMKIEKHHIQSAKKHDTVIGTAAERTMDAISQSMENRSIGTQGAQSASAKSPARDREDFIDFNEHDDDSGDNRPQSSMSVSPSDRMAIARS